MKWKGNLINNILYELEQIFPQNYYKFLGFLQAIFLTAFVMLATSNLYALFKKENEVFNLSSVCIIQTLKFLFPNSEFLVHNLEMRILLSLALKVSSFNKIDTTPSSKCLQRISGDVLSTAVYRVQGFCLCSQLAYRCLMSTMENTLFTRVYRLQGWFLFPMCL